MSFLKRHRHWLLLLIVLGGGLTWWDRWRAWRESSQDAVILAAAARYGVEPALVKAVVWRESRFNPNARGGKGEIGLMQIMGDTAGDWARAERVSLFVPERLFEPAQNTLCGAWYLRKLLRRYPQADNSLPYVLADYNAGRTHVLRWAKGAGVTNSAVFLRQIEYPMTRDYVVSVVKRYRKYRTVFPPGEPHGQR